MDLKKLVEAIDAQVLSGDIVGAFDTFAADQCITFSSTDDVTHSKNQKSEALRWFFSNVVAINNIERLAIAVIGDNETHSQFKFDFTNKQGQSLIYNEVIRRVWGNGKLVEEQYLFGQSIAPAKAKKAQADIVDVSATASAAKKAAPVAKPAAAPAPKKAAPVLKPAAPVAGKAAKTESGKKMAPKAKK
jgi:hypothetical protein